MAYVERDCLFMGVRVSFQRLSTSASRNSSTIGILLLYVSPIFYSQLLALYSSIYKPIY
jgi:hypothetical protein